MTVFTLRRSAALFLLSSCLSPMSSSAQATNNQSKGATAEPVAPVNGKVVEDIVARVNDQIVTQSDYNRALEQLEAEGKQQNVPAAEIAAKKTNLLRDLIDQQLLLSKAKELNITGETELIKRLDELRKQNHLESMEDLEKAYASQAQGTSFEDFKATIRNSIVTQQVVRDEVGRHITISPGDVQKYYKDHETDFAQPESVTLNEILIPTTATADASQIAAAQATADGLIAKLAAGAKFDDLAKPAPADPNAPKSVPLGEFRRGMLAKEIEDKAFALDTGQHTTPIRTKQGFIILQVTDHNRAGEGGFKKAEPQVEEALFLERMQPALRTYLTKLREEAFVDLKSGVIDTGSTPNEMRLSYSAYTPPGPKKKVKFERKRFRGRDRSRQVATAHTATAPAPAAAAAPSAAAPAGETTAPAASEAATATAPPAVAPAPKKAAASQQASTQGIEKPGKREKIRFGQAPRESLPASQVATAVVPDVNPAVTTPETRIVNPDGTISGEVAPVNERKTRLSGRAPVKKVKKDKNADAPAGPTEDELASQKVQNTPLGLADTAAAKKPKKGDKTRYSAKPTQTEQPAPYLGQPAPNSAPASSDTPASSGTPASGSAPDVMHPDPPTNPPSPATGPPDPIPPGAQQP